MLNIGPMELMVILLVALVVVGPKRLPEIGRQVGRALHDVRKMQDEVRDSIRFDVDPDEEPPTRHAGFPATEDAAPSPTPVGAELPATPVPEAEPPVLDPDGVGPAEPATDPATDPEPTGPPVADAPDEPIAVPPPVADAPDEPPQRNGADDQPPPAAESS